MITYNYLCCIILIFIPHIHIIYYFYRKYNHRFFLLKFMPINFGFSKHHSYGFHTGKLWIFQASLLFDTDTLIILKSVNFSGHHSYSIDTLIRYSRVHPAPRPSLLKAGDLKSMEQVWLFEFLLTQTFCIGPIEFVLSGFHCNLYI